MSGKAPKHNSQAQIRAVINAQIKARLEASTAPTPGAEVLNTGLGLSGISVLYRSPDLLASTRRCSRGLVTTTLMFLIASLQQHAVSLERVAMTVRSGFLQHTISVFENFMSAAPVYLCCV